VIVLDAGISAAAALEARERANGASLVVVWPEGVAAVLAEERVDPHLVMEDLGEAVRRASRRAKVRDAPIRIPELLEIASPIEERRVAPVRSDDDDPPEPARPGTKRSRVLVAVATWIMVLTTLTTIAVAVPNALDLFAGDRAPRPSPSAPQARRPDDRNHDTGLDTGSEPAGKKSRPAPCEAPRGDNARADRSRGRDADPVQANGCPPDRGKNAKGNRGQGGGGKPDDPGSQANKGGAQDKERPGRGRATHDEKQASGGSGTDHGPDIDGVGNAGRSHDAKPDDDAKPD
jgi:hypothetical protein